MNMGARQTIGQEIEALARQGQPIADAVNAAISDAFKTGFEHAVSGGQEAARKFPQLKGSMPLVLYFANDKDRQEFADMIHEVKPHMIETKIPEKT